VVDYAHTPSVSAERVLELGGRLRRLDWVLLLAVGGLVTVGLWAIGGITRHDVAGDPTYYVVRQGVFAALGVAGLVAAVLVDPDVYRRYWKVVYGSLIGLLLLVFAAGEVARGSRRWISIGFFRFQPSEFGKLMLTLALAGFLASRAKRMSEPRTVASAVGLTALPWLLVFAEPDIGSSLVYLAALAAVLFIAGTRWLHLGVLGAAALLVAVAVLWLLPAAGMEVLKPYQKARLTGFLNPSKNPGGQNFNLIQSKIGVGSGGVSGRGVHGATQTRLNYLPEHATDFAFASYAEQRGFVGAAILLGLYLLVVWRGLKTVAGARDAFSAMAAGGIVFAFLFQVFVNVGMTIGIAPITGIPLPFVSVGGSSLISNLVAIGVLQAIYARSRANGRGRRF
jgi:rod shape determining protein RodA